MKLIDCSPVEDGLNGNITSQFENKYFYWPNRSQHLTEIDWSAVRETETRDRALVWPLTVMQSHQYYHPRNGFISVFFVVIVVFFFMKAGDRVCSFYPNLRTNSLVNSSWLVCVRSHHKSEKQYRWIQLLMINSFSFWDAFGSLHFSQSIYLERTIIKFGKS